MSKRNKHYLHALEDLQLELVGLNRWLGQSRRRLLVILEGRDTAGKGGTIKAITQAMDTRSYRIAALSKPNDIESSQWYFQRYVPHLPSAGEIVLFDRSWYNRAVVEPAMGFCSHEQYKAFMAAVPTFEKLLTDDGIILIKYWLAVDQKEQEERFADRATNPLKHWKLSPTDLASRRKYADMGHLRDAMIEGTHRPNAPWFVVDFNDQKRGRINLIRHLLEQIPRRDEVFPKLKKLSPIKGKFQSEHITSKALWVPDTWSEDGKAK